MRLQELKQKCHNARPSVENEKQYWRNKYTTRNKTDIWWTLEDTSFYCEVILIIFVASHSVSHFFFKTQLNLFFACMIDLYFEMSYRSVYIDKDHILLAFTPSSSSFLFSSLKRKIISAFDFCFVFPLIQNLIQIHFSLTIRQN